MSMLYITNIMSHHQLPVASELAALLGSDNFRFAVKEPVYAERAVLGWESQGPDAPWIIRTYAGRAEKREFLEWLDKADVVVCGTRDFDLIGPRILAGKLTFTMGERWFRPPLGRKRLLHPVYAAMVLRMLRLAKCNNFHCLTLGTYAARDMAFLRAFKDKMWMWAYFTAMPESQPPPRRNDECRILWAGRLLKIKRVDTLIRAAGRLRQSGVTFLLDIIGDGPMKREIVRESKRLGLGSAVRFHSPMKPEGVREHMRASDIFVLPSSGYEGWGAVVNEAMSEGCVTIACQAAGSARVLIKDGVNGLLFPEGDDRRLAELLSRTIVDADLRARLSTEAARSISQLWSPAAGAQRLVALSQGLLGRESMPGFTEGPCSPSLP